MKTNQQPTAAYVDAAIERIEAGLTRSIRHRARRTGALSLAGAALVLLTAVVSVSLATTPRAVTSPPLALGNKPLTAADVASWTSTSSPAPTASRVVAACSAILAREPLATGSPSIINADVRGRVQSAIVAIGGYSGYCIGTADSEAAFVLLNTPDRPGEPGDSQPNPAPDAITLGPIGGNTSTNGWTFAEGTVGHGVAGVTLHESGLAVAATVSHGTWIAWWPSHGDVSEVGGTITVTGTNGTTSTVTPAEIQVN